VEYCDLCNVRKITHRNVLLRQFDRDHNMSKVTKNLCDKCFNEIKPKETNAARRFNKAEKILDGEE
jgi:hypothetical protein